MYNTPQPGMRNPNDSQPAQNKYATLVQNKQVESQFDTTFTNFLPPAIPALIETQMVPTIPLKVFESSQKILRTTHSFSPPIVVNPIDTHKQKLETLKMQIIDDDKKTIQKLSEEKKYLEEHLEVEKQKFQRFKSITENEINKIHNTMLQMENQQFDLGEENDKLKSSLRQKDFENKQLQMQIQYLNNNNEELQNQILGKDMKTDQSQNAIKKLKEDYDREIKKIFELSEQSKKDSDLQSKNEIKKLKQTIKDQQTNLDSQEQKQNENSLQLQQKIDFEHRNYLSAAEEVADLKRQLQKLKKELKEKDSEVIRVADQLRERTLKYKELQSQIQNQLHQSLSVQQEMQFSQTPQVQQSQWQGQQNYANSGLHSQPNFTQSQIIQLESQYVLDRQSQWQGQQNFANLGLHSQPNFTQSQQIKLESELVLEQYKYNQSQLFQQKEIENEKFNKEIQQKLWREQQDQIVKNQQIKQNLAAEAQIADQKIREAKKTHGKLDVCFLVDITSSMDAYKESTRICISLALQIIKDACNRQTNWAAVCYQDFAEKQQLGGRYQQFDFSDQSTELENWLDSIQCEGGGDFSEDIKGAIEQMCQMQWPSRFKIAILICDAPTHGELYQYQEQGYTDNSPEENITNAIIQMIEKNIILMCLNLNESTKRMYKEIEQIYLQKNKRDLFVYVDLQQINQNQLAIMMSQHIGEVSQNATETNKKESKTKKIVQRPNNRDGAMEALCNKGDFLNFEEQVQIVQTSFNVWKVEMKESSFEANIKQIRNIRIPEDYAITQEGYWQCIRTEQPFAFGKMKDVFLMKKVNELQNDLYVIKTPINSEPYQTMNDAITECRSHLICQRLMKKFLDDLQNGLEQKQFQFDYPNVVYSDFLILEESSTKFWIAERFFNGEFVKYNNNFGYINYEDTILNQLAQTFSFYTYIKSGSTYMISDVQGVDKYFTDPAINTLDGNYDETDMGEDGIKMYLVVYEKRRETLSNHILEILGLYQKPQEDY